MDQLLHALNQPITGLQCSLELAVARPRSQSHYVRVLREGLELTGRIRTLVKAARELMEVQRPQAKTTGTVLLNELLETTIEDLVPVANDRGVRLQLRCLAILPVQADRSTMSALIFRFLEAVLSLSADCSPLRIYANADRDLACVSVQWQPGQNAQEDLFSAPALALAISQAGWEQAGAHFERLRTGDVETCSLHMPMATASPADDWEI